MLRPLTFAILLCPPATLASQTGPPHTIAVGDTIRVPREGRPPWRTGTIYSITTDSVAIRMSGGVETLARPQAAGLQYAGGRKRSGKTGYIMGGLIGGIVGLFAGLATYQPCPECMMDFGAGYSAFLGAALGVTGGGVIGFTIGYNVWHTHWEPVALPHGAVGARVRLK